MVPPMSKDLNKFVAACETLLASAFIPAELTQTELQMIQYYLSALSAKFPALTN